MGTGSFDEGQIWLTQKQVSPLSRRPSTFETIWSTGAGTGHSLGTGVAGGGNNMAESMERKSSDHVMGLAAAATGGGGGGGNFSGQSGQTGQTGGGLGAAPLGGPAVAGPGSVGNSLWGMGRAIGAGPPPEFAAHFADGTNRNSIGGGPLSPTSAQLDMEKFGPYGFNLRRHSYGDIYSNGSKVVTHPGRPGWVPPLRESVLKEDNTRELVDKYFDEDPHGRVKVTVRFLEERFFEEEQYLGESYQLPRFPIENSLRNYQLVLVGFKAGRIDVFHLSGMNELPGLKVGDLVVVEADRGRDLGKILKMNVSIDEARLMKFLQFQEQQAALSDNGNIFDLTLKNMNAASVSPPTLHFPKSIVSFAQANDILQILNKKQDEEKACRLCLAKISSAANSAEPQGLNSAATVLDLLQMKLIDAEYQFDRKKLIFYYSTTKRIDFRDLVRELFRIYKTRIWMCAAVGTPYSPKHTAQDVNTSPISGQQVSDKEVSLRPNAPTAAAAGPPMVQANAVELPPFFNSGAFAFGGQGNFQGSYNQSAPFSAPGAPGAFPGMGANANANANANGNTSGFGLNHGGFSFQNDSFGGPLVQQGPPYGEERRLSLEEYNRDYNRRLTGQVNKGNIPRKFIDQNRKEDECTNESFVLKSLVDSIDH